jgi:hypothetical protein
LVKEKPEAMTIEFALFNEHANDANVRARKLMTFVCPKWLEEVDKMSDEGGGIMALLNDEPTPATAFYIALITAYVNEDREIPA